MYSFSQMNYSFQLRISAIAVSPSRQNMVYFCFHGILIGLCFAFVLVQNLFLNLRIRVKNVLNSPGSFLVRVQVKINKSTLSTHSLHGAKSFYRCFSTSSCWKFVIIFFFCFLICVNALVRPEVYYSTIKLV